MKAKYLNKVSTDQDSAENFDCSCEILNDTSLENISDTDCSCSQCLQANLDAFNQFKDLQQRQNIVAAKSLDKLKIKKNKYNQNQNQNTKIRNSSQNRNSNFSQNKKTVKKSHLINNQEGSPNQSHGNHLYYDNIRNGSDQFTQQNINDYILITKQRTRQYMIEHKKQKNKNKVEQQKLKQKIKENLQILKYTAQVIKQKDNIQKQRIIQSKKEQQQNQQNQAFERHQWNHAPVISRQLEKIRRKKKQCKIKIKLRKNIRKKVDTNLDQFIPEFSLNRKQLLQQAKVKRLQKLKPCVGCPHDSCPNHHMRTSKSKLLEIQQFIRKQVQKYNENKNKQKFLQQQKQKIRKAKLRAIDLKCKQKVAKSKKYDPSASRTSFHLSIDHFSTFSDLKAHKVQKDQERQHKRQVRKMMKQKGGRLQQAIYQDVFQNEGQIKQQIRLPVEKKKLKIDGESKQYCQKIMKQAKIHSPKKIKPQDQQYKKIKKQPSQKMNPNDEKKKVKEVQLEIQRKKRELMKQYKKQKQLNQQAKNQKLKNSYKRQIDSK